ncbi:hypothetical protein V8E36_008779 [Tilletia maclaganii]
MDLDARSGNDPPPDGSPPGAPGLVGAFTPATAAGDGLNPAPATASFSTGVGNPPTSGSTATQNSRKRKGAVLNDARAASVDIHANLTKEELRVVIAQRDEQIRQLQTTLSTVVRSNETLVKTNATISVTNNTPEASPRLPQGPSSSSRRDGVATAVSASNHSPAPPQSFSFSVHSQRPTQPSFAQLASAAKDLPLRNLDAERQVRALSLVPLSAAARRQRKIRSTTPASAYDQCYVKLASKRISKLKEDLAFIVVRVDLVHNIALPTAYAAELTFLKDRKEELFGSLRKCGIPILHDFNPARAHGPNPSTEQKTRVLAQYNNLDAPEMTSASSGPSSQSDTTTASQQTAQQVQTPAPSASQTSAPASTPGSGTAETAPAEGAAAPATGKETATTSACREDSMDEDTPSGSTGNSTASK